jgi:hypothetical protein
MVAARDNSHAIATMLLAVPSNNTAPAAVTTDDSSASSSAALCQLSCADTEGCTALHYSARTNSITVLTMLLGIIAETTTAASDRDDGNRSSSCPPSSLSSSTSSSFFCLVDQRAVDGTTPLVVAAKHGAVGIVRPGVANE